MKSPARLCYNALVPLATAGAYASTLFLPKMREAVDGRKGFRERWRDLPSRLGAPPVWFHVSSVGEFEQARPVISAIERSHPGIPIMITFSSPSGYSFAMRRETIGAGAIRFIDYLPFDTAHRMRVCLDQARPRLLVFVKFDLWPNLAWEAADAGVPMILIDATLSATSKRLRFPARHLYADIYRRLDAILAISEDDAARFAASVPEHRDITVVGDTRFDRVMERWNNRSSVALDLPKDGARILIAGSTWPADEARLLPALERLLRDDPHLRVIIVPHEPTPEHVAPLRDWAKGAGLSARAMGNGDGPSDARVVIVDTVGVLAEAYRVADVAYVGGAFSTGVHSVIEPAIAGIPVVFGPRHRNSFEALRLVATGGGMAVQTADEAHAALHRYLSDDAARTAAGAAARAYVESQLGATQKCMAVIERYL